MITLLKLFLFCHLFSLFYFCQRPNTKNRTRFQILHNIMKGLPMNRKEKTVFDWNCSFFSRFMFNVHRVHVHVVTISRIDRMHCMMIFTSHIFGCFIVSSIIQFRSSLWHSLIIFFPFYQTGNRKKNIRENYANHV